MDYESLLIHGGYDADDSTGSVNVPIYLTSTFKQKSFDGHQEFGYSRGANPTRKALEKLIAQLENGKFGFAFASGMAATSGALSILKTGEKVLVTNNVYGGTYGLLEKILLNFGITYELVNTSDLLEVEKKFDDNVKAVFIETPSNPLLTITDINAISKIAKSHNAITIVDNTFLTPYLQKPLELGADIVVHSATKYLGGHSDSLAGLAVTNDEKLADKIGAFQKLVGGIQQPFDSYLIIRGIKTLAVRIDRAVENTEYIVEFLKTHPAVDKIYYPGLPDHKGYQINEKQTLKAGAMLSFILNEKYDKKIFFEALELITSGASLGGVETLISHPATGSHSSFSKELREAIGISDNLVRLSVGIESKKDIVKDLEQALEKSLK